MTNSDYVTIVVTPDQLKALEVVLNLAEYYKSSLLSDAQAIAVVSQLLREAKENHRSSKPRERQVTVTLEKDNQLDVMAYP